MFALAALGSAPLSGQSTAGVDLYRQLATTPLDGQRIFHIRDADLDLEDLHLSFEEGTIAFTQAVDGKTTGALFTGEGAILVIPPNQVERASLARFTKSAVLNERFHSVYLRFNDEGTLKALEAALRAPVPAPESAEFLARWDPLVKNLAAISGDALRLTLSLLNQSQPHSRFVHARIAGDRLGVFDALYNQSDAEAILVAQSSSDAVTSGTHVTKEVFENIWLSFAAKSQRAAAVAPAQTSTKRRANEVVQQTDQLQPDENGLAALLDIRSFDIAVDVTPPTEISATAKLRVSPRHGGVRALLFQLSRNLKVASVRLDGTPVEFLQNPALPGSQTARTGNDVVAVVMPVPLSEAEHEMTFQYAGAVMTDTGGGFLYVGDRGTWYPNFGFRNAMFDLKFRVPSPWKLVASGEPVADGTPTKELHFRTSKPVPVVGFNVGKFTEAQSASTSRSAAITVFGTEHDQATETTPLSEIADHSAQTVNFLEQHLGAFPYHALSITEVPGGVSQGWPSLVYLSTAAFSGPKLGAEPRSEFARIVFKDLVLPHEIGHQYWGDNVAWRSYREQWTSEALANYCALMLLEQKDSSEPATVLGHYRDSLLRRGTPDAPVTLGLRLDSSLTPDGYTLQTYGRGTWLIHMLRSMLRDASELEARGAKNGASADFGSGYDDAFWRALKSLQTEHAGGAIGAKDLESAFEKVMPRKMNYEGAASLAWFFEDWVNGTAVPTFTLGDVTIAPTGAASGTISTTDSPKDFTALLPIYAEMKDGKQVLVAQVFADDPETSFKVKAPAGSVKLLLDPKREVLRRE